jgi:hypothetical protein
MVQNDSVSKSDRNFRVAIVHYWLIGRGGGERVVEALAEVYPQADIYTLLADPATLKLPSLTNRRITLR